MPAWSLHPDVLALCVALEGGYLGFVRRHQTPVARRTIAWFTAGVLTIWVAASWPIHELGERSLYSVHMVQHVLLMMVAPPMLLIGTPDWLARKLLRARPVLLAARQLSRPFFALVLFNIVLVLTHWPVVVGLAVRSPAAHLATHAAIFTTSLFLWVPVASPVIELPRLPYPGQILYVFLQSIVPTVPASFLTFSSGVIYPAYAHAHPFWGIDVVTDQRIAGLFMKLVGGAILWSIAGVLFFRWYARENEEGVDVMKWQDVERDLRRVTLGAGERGS